MYFVYAIQNSTTHKIYVGQTADLEKRLLRHNKLLPTKKSTFTSKSKGQWIYIYIEECLTRSSALAREKQLKSARGREFVSQYKMGR